MSEDWLSARHPYKMIYHPACRDVRKRRLLSVACARRGIGLLPEDGPYRATLDFVERYADGEADNTEWKHARRRLRKAMKTLDDKPSIRAAAAVLATTEKKFGSFKMSIEYVCHALGKQDPAHWDAIIVQENAAQSDMVREIFENPFQPVELDESRLNDVIVTLATQIYDNQRYDAMPVLGDALEEAGFRDQAMLEHCRSVEGHLRGCWVVDRIRQTK